MKLYLTDQSKHFAKHLEFLKTQKVKKVDIRKLKEKITTIEISSGRNLSKLTYDFLFDYKIFPENILTFLTQWNIEKRKMQVGDTIVQQAFIPPFKSLSAKLIFGVRITQVIYEPTRIGFGYKTIEGHVEMGESIFTIETISNGTPIFKIHTFSQPGNILARLVQHLFTLPYQKYCTLEALKAVKQKLEKQE